MLTRRFAAFLLLTLVLAGCANNTAPNNTAPNDTAPGASSATQVSAPAPSGSVVASPTPSAEDSSGKPPVAGAETISGLVIEGVEPNCLVLHDSSGNHVLMFAEPGLRSAAKVSARVTLTGRSVPTMMTTCQQGVPFVVSSVSVG